MRIGLLATAAASGLLLAGAAAAQTTGVTGGGQPINNYQPSLVMTQTVQDVGIFPVAGSGCCNSYLGQIHTFAGNFAPYVSPTASGQLLSISQNEALFELTGTTYGGDGVTTFALPDLAGRAAMGAGLGPGLGPRVLGEEVGVASNVMTLAQLPDHDHTLPGGGVTGVTGSPAPAPLNNVQPSLALNYDIAVQGLFPSRDSGNAGEPFLGQIGLFSEGFAPGGYLPADGRLLPINQNQALFSVLGTTYGGDGVTTFALPDLRGRVIVGAGQGPGFGDVNLGERFGGENTVLTDGNLPIHDHTLPGGGDTGFTGVGLPFDNDQPSLGLNYIIALQGIFPSRTGGGWPDDEPTLGEVFAFAGDFAPVGYALANGQLLSISGNTALFSLIGTLYGGNGTTTFALPDLRGRTILGAGNGFDVGDMLGQQTTTLTVAQLVPHDHTLPAAPGVPEPSVWALLIAGFGAVGAALRRRAAIV